jgi:hypothetical protein
MKCKSTGPQPHRQETSGQNNTPRDSCLCISVCTVYCVLCAVTCAVHAVNQGVLTCVNEAIDSCDSSMPSRYRGRSLCSSSGMGSDDSGGPCFTLIFSNLIIERRQRQRGSHRRRDRQATCRHTHPPTNPHTHPHPPPTTNTRTHTDRQQIPTHTSHLQPLLERINVTDSCWRKRLSCEDIRDATVCDSE